MTTEAEFRAKADARAIEAMAKAIYDTRYPFAPKTEWARLDLFHKAPHQRDAIAALAAYRGAMWMPMSEAPKDVHVLVGTDGAHGLAAFTTIVKHHPDGGFCVDELREPIACQPLPLPPTEEPK